MSSNNFNELVYLKKKMQRTKSQIFDHESAKIEKHEIRKKGSYRNSKTG